MATGAYPGLAYPGLEHPSELVVVAEAAGSGSGWSAFVDRRAIQWPEHPDARTVPRPMRAGLRRRGTVRP